MKNIIKIVTFSILLLQIQAHLLRGEKQPLFIQEVIHSALYPDNLQIILPDSYEHDNSCSELVLNDSHLCHIKQTKNSTITCDYPVYLLENESTLTNQNCRAFCQETPGCSILINYELEEKLIRNLQSTDLFSFSPQSASFVYPSYITIDLKKINQKITNVFLSNAQNTYEAIILKQDVSSLVCLIKGGNTGDYTIQLVTKTTKIVSTALFSLQITITSVSPQQGSIDGGVILTINGTNFSMRDQENQIKIGSVPCTIFSSSLTQLLCITQKLDNSNLPSVNTPYDVIVYNGNQQSTIQGNNGQFTFIQAINKPLIQTIGSNIKGKFIQGETVVITGTNLQVEGEDTILLIGGFNTTIDSLNPTQLNFTVGFDMPNIPQKLSIYVGTQGSTDDQEVVAPSMLLNSSCLVNNVLFAPKPLNSGITYNNFFMDLNLSNYDPTYAIQVTTNVNILDPSQIQITQDTGDKNLIYLRLNQIPSTTNLINSILVAGDEILDTPIQIQYTGSYPFTALTPVEVDSNSFVVQYTSQFANLVVYSMLIRNQQFTKQYVGQMQNNYFGFLTLPNSQDLYNNIIIEGCSNQGSFTTSLDVNNNQFVFQTAQQTLNILDNPFPSGLVYPGQKFKVQFTSSYIPISDFLVVECQNVFSPIFAENEENSDNIYEFVIPPVPLQTQFDGTLQCSLYHKSQWNSQGDSYLSKHTLFSSQFSNLQNLISQQTMMEDINKLSITYQSSTNIIVNSITPSSISYIGGDIIEFKGINFVQIDPSLVQIQINGINCTVTEATSTYIHCISGFQPKMQWLEESYVSVSVNGTKANMQAPRINIVMRQIDPLPFVGFLEFYDSSSKVYIPQYYSIIMDDIAYMNGKSVSYDRILVDGTLVFLNTISYQLTLNMLIGNGQVLIGSTDSPFGSSTFILNVTGQTNVFNISAYSTDTLVFVNLVSSALSGANTINIQSSDITKANLNAGDEIIITGTTNGSVYEKVKIATISGSVITLTASLTSDHIVASEVLKPKDGSTYNFNISPTVFKVSMSVQLNFVNQVPYSKTLNDYYPPSRSFQLSGVSFTFSHQQVYNYQYNFNVINSFLNFHDQTGGNCVNFASFTHNVLIDQQSNCHTLSNTIQNSLFLSNQINQFNVNSGVTLTNNVFQGSELILPQGQFTDKTTISNNTIYASDVCIRYPFSDYYGVPLVMDNNICFSSNYAMEAVFTGLIQSQKYYLVAVNILKGAIIQLNDYYCSQYKQLNTLSVSGKAFFQSQLTNGNQNLKPVAYSNQESSIYSICLVRNLISNVEFKGFTYSATDYIVENLNSIRSFYKVLSFANITQDFNGILLPDTPDLIIRDEDGTFSGVGKQSNLVAHSSYLYDSSCNNQKQYSICQNSLVHSYPIYALCVYQTSCTFSFTRSNTYILSNPFYGQFFVSTETYTVNLVDGSNNSQSIQLFSMAFDYQQDSTKAIVLIFPTNSDYIFHSVISLFTDRISDLGNISSYPSFNEQTSKLDPASCSHGDSYYDSSNIQVCYKELSSVTLYVSYYPEVYPTPAKIPIETKIRQFSNSKDWVENSMSMKSPKRWTILPHWRMQISIAGVYNLPSLVVQGTLEIVGSADITLNLRGIYIGAGSLTVSSSYTGKLTINLVSTDPKEIIFNNPFESASYNEGSIVVNNKLNIFNTQNNLPYYRVIKYNNVNQQDVKNQILVQNLKATSVSKGDTIFIVSPRTGQYILTTVSDYPRQITFDNTLLTLKDNLSISFSTVLDNFRLNSTSTLQFTPYVKIFKQRIQINNFNIYSLSHSSTYIPQVLLQGVNFQDSKLTQQKLISSFVVQDCVFQVSKSQDYYFNNKNTLFYQTPTYTFINNLFINSQNPIQIDIFTDYNGNPYPYASGGIITLTNNMIVDCANAISSQYSATLKNNVVIKSSNICAVSPTCLQNNNDAFYQCSVSGVNYANCNSISNLLVAYSGTFFQGKIYQISNVLSISNLVHFQAYPGGSEIFGSSLFQYNIQINNAVVIVDLFDSDQTCTPSSCIQLISPNSDQLQAPTFTISNSKFFNIVCSNGIFFKTNTPLNEIYHTSVAFQNTPCSNCQFASTNLISTSSQVPPSLLVQDYQSVFLGQNPNDSSSYIFTAQDTSPFIKSEHSPNILGRLFIKTQSSSNPNSFSLQGNTYNVQQITSLSGTIIVFPLNNVYQLIAASYSQIVLRMSSHNLQPLEYLQVQIPIGKEKGLKIRNNQGLLTPTPGLDNSNGYGIMSMVGQQQSKIQCGVNIYDPATDSYHIILTNDPNCQVSIYEYTTTNVVIVIPTPILPPPPPEEIHLCLAQRQMLYIVNKISAILGIDKRRIKMKSQSNFSTCKNSRILQSDGSSSDSISFSFAIDPEDSDNESNCTFNPSCSSSDISTQNLNASAQNLQTFQSLQTFQDKAVQSGFVVSSIQSSLPSLVSPCTQGQYYQNGDCVASCSSNYYLYSQQNQNVCVKCNVACNSCTGPNTTDCKVLQNSQLLDCVSGYSTFQNESSQNYCGKCPSNCAIDCKSLLVPLCPSSQCLQGYVNQNGYCLQQCFSGYFNYNNNGVCKKCMTGCKDQCSNGTCTCSDGFYPFVTQSQVCSPCPQYCATCSSDTVCRTCLDVKYDERTLCEMEKYVPQEQGQSQLGLILGLTIGLSGGAIIIYALIQFYFKLQKAKKYIQRIKTQEEIESEPDLNSNAKQTVE